MQEGESVTDTEIKKLSAQRYADNSGDCVALMIYQYSVITFILLAEYAAYYIFKNVGYDWFYSFKELVHGNSMTWIFWICKSVIELALVSPGNNLIRRLYLDVAMGRDITESRRYITAHSMKYFSKACYCAFVQWFIKITALIPGILAVCGINYWAHEITINELTSGALFCLTACLSISATWAFLAVKYYISLAMTPYIMALNPRTNIFDACDLSVRLMDGKHVRYITFVASYLKFLPFMLLIYPFFGVYPYFKVSYSLFMYELLGDKNHDKMPGMIKRWKKYMNEN